MQGGLEGNWLLGSAQVRGSCDIPCRTMISISSIARIDGKQELIIASALFLFYETIVLSYLN